MGLQGNLEDTPPNTVLDFRSDSPAIITKEQIISDKDANVSLQTVKCSKCDRSFTIERIQKHEEICNKVKERKVYDIVEMRVKGTDTEALVKAGKHRGPKGRGIFSWFFFKGSLMGFSEGFSKGFFIGFFSRDFSKRFFQGIFFQGFFQDFLRETFPLLQLSTEHELSIVC